jgi:hypothetical protein
MEKLCGYTLRLKNRSQLPILHKRTSNNIYVALDFKTNGTYEVICNSNGSQKSGGGVWSDIPIDQRLSSLKGKGRDKYLNKRNFKSYSEAKKELLQLEEVVEKIEYL